MAQAERLEEVARSRTLAAREVPGAKGEPFRSIGQALDCDHRTAWQRNGTTTSLAALNTLDGTVISGTRTRHRPGEWLNSLQRLH
jgi:hypothetical protein